VTDLGPFSLTYPHGVDELLDAVAPDAEQHTIVCGVDELFQRLCQVERDGAADLVSWHQLEHDDPQLVALLQLQPLLDRDRYSDAEWLLSSNGRCGSLVADYPRLTWCLEPSDPGSFYRYCTEHDRHARDESTNYGA
jgi:hypothetical protein